MCELIRSRLTVVPNLCDATNQILDVCLSKGSRDNMTLVLVVFDSAPKLDQKAVEEENEWSKKMEKEIYSMCFVNYITTNFCNYFEFKKMFVERFF